MTEREKKQADYWQGGEIGGFTFYPLNLDRAALLQGVESDAQEKGISITGADRTKVAMAIYNLADVDAESWKPDYEKLLARAAERGLGRMTMRETDEFSKGFAQDVNCLLASQAEADG